FFPTASEVRALARSRLDKDKVSVIIGGTSVMHGTGQRSGQVWTERLQRLLGDRYQVLNLALRSGASVEFGALAAEVIASDHRRLLYVTDYRAPVEPDGFRYRYLFWDAYWQGLLRENLAREDWVREVARRRADDEAFWELQRAMWLDHWLRARDLWSRL